MDSLHLSMIILVIYNSSEICCLFPSQSLVHFRMKPKKFTHSNGHISKTSRFVTTPLSLSLLRALFSTRWNTPTHRHACTFTRTQYGRADSQRARESTILKRQNSKTQKSISFRKIVRCFHGFCQWLKKKVSKSMFTIVFS